MDFALNEEQQMLQEAAQRFLTENHPCTRARKALPWSDPLQRDLWKAMADMGWNSLLLPEEQGGSDLGAVEASLIAESAGQNLLNLPWSSSAVLLALLEREAGVQTLPELSDAVQSMSQGRSCWHCINDDQSHWDFATQSSNFIWIRGLVEQNDKLQLAFIRSQSLQKCAPALDTTISIGITPVVPTTWHEISITQPAKERIRSTYRLMQASELVGVGQAALTTSTSYAKERMQFGKLIGSYQSIKHQLANMWMLLDNARLSVMYAAAAIDSKLHDQALACAVAEFAAIDSALQCTRSSIQVHGALGFTWEHDAHLYLKRAQHLATRLGGASTALRSVESIALS